MPKPDGMSRNKWKRLRRQIRKGNQEEPTVKPITVSTDEPKNITVDGNSTPLDPKDLTMCPTTESTKIEGITKKCLNCANEYGNAKYNTEVCRDCFDGSNWKSKQ